MVFYQTYINMSNSQRTDQWPDYLPNNAIQSARFIFAIEKDINTR